MGLVLGVPAGAGTPAEVELVEHLGDSAIVHLRVAGAAELLHAKLGAAQAGWRAGQPLGLQPEPGAVLAFDGAGRRIP